MDRILYINGYRGGRIKMPLLTPGNSKLGRKILSFSLPAKKTCKPSKWCQEKCYACKGLFLAFQDRISKCYERNYQASLSDTFIEEINNELAKKRNPSYIRIHASGDFYSQEYIKKWIEIARNNPRHNFLAFTKRMDLEKELIELALSGNVAIYQSIDESITYRSKYFRKAAIDGYGTDINPRTFIKCSGSCSDCLMCWKNTNNIMLKEH